VQDAGDATTAPALPLPAPPPLPPPLAVVATMPGTEGTGEGVAMPRVAVTVVVAATAAAATADVSSAAGAPTTTRASIAPTGATWSGSSRCSRYRGEHELPDQPSAPPAASNGMHSIAALNVQPEGGRESVSGSVSDDEGFARSTSARTNDRSGGFVSDHVTTRAEGFEKPRQSRITLPMMMILWPQRRGQGSKLINVTQE